MLLLELATYARARAYRTKIPTEVRSLRDLLFDIALSSWISKYSVFCVL